MLYAAATEFGKFVPKTVVYFNREAANFGFDKVARSMSYHGTKMFLENNVDSFDDDRPSAIDAIYSADMVNKMHGEVDKKEKRGRGRRAFAFAFKKLAGGSMLLEDADERKKLKNAMYPFKKFISVKVDEDDDDEDDESDDEEDGNDDAMDDSDEVDDDDDLDARNERRRQQGKIAKKQRKAQRKPKKKQKKKTLPFKRGDNKDTTSTSSTSRREVETNASLIDQERARRESTVEATRQSEEQKGKVIRGKAENSLKRRALAIFAAGCRCTPV